MDSAVKNAINIKDFLCNVDTSSPKFESFIKN